MKIFLFVMILSGLVWTNPAHAQLTARYNVVISNIDFDSATLTDKSGTISWNFKDQYMQNSILVEINTDTLLFSDDGLLTVDINSIVISNVGSVPQTITFSKPSRSELDLSGTQWRTILFIYSTNNGRVIHSWYRKYYDFNNRLDPKWRWEYVTGYQVK